MLVRHATGRRSLFCLRNLLRLCRQTSTQKEAEALPAFPIPAFSADVSVAQTRALPRSRHSPPEQSSHTLAWPKLQDYGETHTVKSGTAHTCAATDASTSHFVKQFAYSTASQDRTGSSDCISPTRRASSADATIDPAILRAVEALTALAQPRNGTGCFNGAEKSPVEETGVTGPFEAERKSAEIAAIFTALLGRRKSRASIKRELDRLCEPLLDLLGGSSRDVDRLLDGIAELAANDSPHFREIILDMLALSVWRSQLIFKSHRSPLASPIQGLPEFLVRYEETWQNNMLSENPMYALASLRPWAEVVEMAHYHTRNPRYPDWVRMLRRFIYQRLHDEVKLPETEVAYIVATSINFLSSPLLQNLHCARSSPDQHDFAMSKCDSTATRFWLYLERAYAHRASKSARRLLEAALAARLPTLANAIVRFVSAIPTSVTPDYLQTQLSRLASLCVSCGRHSLLKHLIAEHPQLVSNARLLQACITRLMLNAGSPHQSNTARTTDPAKPKLAQQLSELLQDFSTEQVILDPYLVASLLRAACRMPLEDEQRLHMSKHIQILAQLALSHLSSEEQSHASRKAQSHRKVIEAAVADNNLRMQQVVQKSEHDSGAKLRSASALVLPGGTQSRPANVSWPRWKVEIAQLTSQALAMLHAGDLSGTLRLHHRLLDVLCYQPARRHSSSFLEQLRHAALKQVRGLYSAFIVNVITVCLRIGSYSTLLQMLESSVSNVGRMGLGYRGIRRVIFYIATRSIEATHRRAFNAQSDIDSTTNEFLRTLRMSATWADSADIGQPGSGLLDTYRVAGGAEGRSLASRDVLLVRKIADAVGRLCAARCTIASKASRADWEVLLEAGLAATQALNTEDIDPEFESSCIRSAQQHILEHDDADADSWWADFERDVVRYCGARQSSHRNLNGQRSAFLTAQ